jgi:hypothetical protein
MSGLEWTALSVVCVVLYVAGAGLAFRLLGAPEAGPAFGYRSTEWPCGCRVIANYAGRVTHRCADHDRYNFDLVFSMLWPVTGVVVGAYKIIAAVVRPLAATFRVCAGLNRPHSSAASVSQNNETPK